MFHGDLAHGTKSEAIFFYGSQYLYLHKYILWIMATQELHYSLALGKWQVELSKISFHSINLYASTSFEINIFHCVFIFETEGNHQRQSKTPS